VQPIAINRPKKKTTERMIWFLVMLRA